MSPYVADPLCRGGAECSQRDESGIVWGFGADIGGVEGPQVHQRGMVGFYLPSGTVQRPLWSHFCDE